jgi:hypothetical protein
VSPQSSQQSTGWISWTKSYFFPGNEVTQSGFIILHTDGSPLFSLKKTTKTKEPSKPFFELTGQERQELFSAIDYDVNQIRNRAQNKDVIGIKSLDFVFFFFFHLFKRTHTHIKKKGRETPAQFRNQNLLNHAEERVR